MSKSDAGKGDDTRPRAKHVTKEFFDDEYDRIFRHGKYAEPRKESDDADAKREKHVTD